MLIRHDTKPVATRARERGAILVTSLLLLLVLTIIGISVMQMTRMQERMSGNSSDVNIAFQGAEAGLRGAESKILGFTKLPALCVASPCDTAYSRDVLPQLNAEDEDYWKDKGTKFTDTNLGSGLEEEPRYILEQLTFIPFSSEFGETTGRDFYQSSSRSTGASGDATVVVQSTFARTAN